MVPSLWFISFLSILIFSKMTQVLGAKDFGFEPKQKTCIAGVLAFISLTFADCLFLSCSSDFEELGAHLESWRLVISTMPLGLPWRPSVQTKVLLAGSIQGCIRRITFPPWAVNIEFSLRDPKWPSHPWIEIFLWEISFHFQPPHLTAYHSSHTSS